MKDASESDLQKAIDDIARANGASSGVTAEDVATASAPAPSGDTNATYEATNGQVPVAGQSTMPEVATVPTAAASEPVAPEVVAPAAEPAPVAGEPEPAAEQQSDAPTEPAEAPANDNYDQMDSDEVREKAIDDLTPIINTVDLKPIVSKMDLLPETKFKIYKNIIETTRDKSALGLAYATAKDIANDDARAEALLYVVEMTEKL